MSMRKSKSYWPTGVRACGCTLSIRELVNNFGSGVYRMSDMQRGDTYTDKQRNDLIASVLQRIPIGEITLMRNASEDVDWDYDVLDGGHRLRTLHAFCSGEFAFANGDKSSAFLRDFDGKKFSDFSRAERSRFFCTAVSVTKLEPEDVSADGARRCASAVLAKKMELGVKPTRETIAVVKRGASDPEVGRVLHAVRDVMESVVSDGYRSAEVGAGVLRLSALRSASEQIVAGVLSSVIGQLSTAKVLCRFSAEQFRAALNGGFFGGLCGELLGVRSCRRALSPSRQVAVVALGCAFTSLGRDEFLERVVRADSETRRSDSTKNVIRVQTVVAAVKALLLDRDSVRSDILRMASVCENRNILRDRLRSMPSVYNSEYKAMRAEGVI